MSRRPRQLGPFEQGRSSSHFTYIRKYVWYNVLGPYLVRGPGAPGAAWVAGAVLGAPTRLSWPVVVVVVVIVIAVVIVWLSVA